MSSAGPRGARQVVDDARAVEQRGQPDRGQDPVGDEAGRGAGERLADHDDLAGLHPVERAPRAVARPAERVVALGQRVEHLQRAPPAGRGDLAGEPQERRLRRVLHAGQDHDAAVGIVLVQEARAGAEVDAAHAGGR